MAQIDFEYNSHCDKTEQVQYFYSDGKLAGSYKYDDLWFWAFKEFWNIDEDELEKYIDDNWVRISTEFYNFKNPNSFQSANTEQETNRDLK